VVLENVGYDPESGEFGVYRRLYSEHEHLSCSCGKIGRITEWYKTEYAYACENIRLLRHEGQLAVLVDYKTGADGKPVPRTAPELAELTALARQAAGVDDAIAGRYRGRGVTDCGDLAVGDDDHAVLDPLTGTGEDRAADDGHVLARQAAIGRGEGIGDVRDVQTPGQGHAGLGLGGGVGHRGSGVTSHGGAGRQGQ
jgi:hypothetical protein